MNIKLFARKKFQPRRLTSAIKECVESIFCRAVHEARKPGLGFGRRVDRIPFGILTKCRKMIKTKGFFFFTDS